MVVVRTSSDAFAAVAVLVVVFVVVVVVGVGIRHAGVMAAWTTILHANCVFPDPPAPEISCIPIGIIDGYQNGLGGG